MGDVSSPSLGGFSGWRRWHPHSHKKPLWASVEMKGSSAPVSALFTALWKDRGQAAGSERLWEEVGGASRWAGLPGASPVHGRKVLVYLQSGDAAMKAQHLWVGVGRVLQRPDQQAGGRSRAAGRGSRSGSSWDMGVPVRSHDLGPRCLP